MSQPHHSSLTDTLEGACWSEDGLIGVCACVNDRWASGFLPSSSGSACPKGLLNPWWKTHTHWLVLLYSSSEDTLHNHSIILKPSLNHQTLILELKLVHTYAHTETEGVLWCFRGFTFFRDQKWIHKDPPPPHFLSQSLLLNCSPPFVSSSQLWPRKPNRGWSEQGSTSGVERKSGR